MKVYIKAQAYFAFFWVLFLQQILSTDKVCAAEVLEIGGTQSVLQLDEGALERLNEIYHVEGENSEIVKKNWISFLMSSGFFLKIQNQDSSEKKPHPLIDYSMPASLPRWESGYSSRSRPFSIDDYIKKQNEQINKDAQEYKKTFQASLDSKIAQFYSNPYFEQWTLEFIAFFLNQAIQKKETSDTSCKMAEKGLHALHLLTGGMMAAGIEKSNSILLIYFMAFEDGDAHPCRGFMKYNWGLPPLRHPTMGQKEVSRIQGDVKAPLSFAKILSGNYIQNYDWVMSYDESVLQSSIKGMGNVVWTKKKGIKWDRRPERNVNSKITPKEILRDWSRRIKF